MLEQISSDKSDISARHQAPHCVQLATYFCSVERDRVAFYAHSVVRKIQSPTHAARSYSGKRLLQQKLTEQMNLDHYLAGQEKCRLADPREGLQLLIGCM